MARKGLGRGLEAIFADDTEEETSVQKVGTMTVPLADIAPDPDQPRKSFNEAMLEELAASIRSRGLLQPILVRPVEGQKTPYIIIAGERRWRASARAKLHDVPVIIKDVDPGVTAEIALIENLQRTDLNPIEEADAYQRIRDIFGRKAQEIADAVGKSRSHVTNMMRLTALPDDVRAHVVEGKLTMGHARALLSAEDAKSIADEIIRKGLSVRETEKLIYSKSKTPKLTKSVSSASETKTARKTDADTRSLENDLEAALGLSVAIEHSKKGGSVTLTYDTLDQLDDICRRLMGTSV